MTECFYSRRCVLCATMFAFLVLLGACATIDVPVVDPVDMAERTQNRIEREIADGSMARAIQQIGVSRNAGTIDDEILDRLYDSAVTGIADAARRAVENGDYRAALIDLENLAILSGEKKDVGISRDDLLVRLAMKYRDEGNVVAALQYYLELDEPARRDPEELASFIRYAAENKNRLATRRLLETADEVGVDVGSEHRETSEATPDLAEMVAGTVTIWVNRGIRIQRGVGYPDRVIGSGFFIDPRGYIITNYHIIESEVDPTYRGYSRLYIRLPDSPDERVPARVVGYDRVFDVALLKVEVDPEYFFSFSSIRTLRPGTPIYAIGSPGGLYSTITSGIVSATGRRFFQMGDALQMDVPINPGNSGGPVVTSDGDLVGVIFAGIQQFQGVNFAIPSWWIRAFVPRLYDGGPIKHGWVGAALHEFADTLTVTYVAPGSPAAEVGLESGDVISRVGGLNAKKIADVQALLLKHEPGHLIELEWLRDDTKRRNLVLLSERPYSPIEDVVPTEARENLIPALFGMEISSTGTRFLRRTYVVDHVYPGSIADETGLSVQDPFSIQNWEIDLDRRTAVMQIVVRQRKAGFLESGVQLGTYIEIDTFF